MFGLLSVFVRQLQKTELRPGHLRLWQSVLAEPLGTLATSVYRDLRLNRAVGVQRNRNEAFSIRS